MMSRIRRQIQGAAAALVCAVPCIVATQETRGAVAIDADDIGGMVTSAKGPEAGVWVIAETTDLPTKFARIVVTDDQGRYLLPDMPKASYNVWVRGYGLVDSPHVESGPARALNLAGCRRADAAGGGPVLSAELLAVDHEASRGRPIRHGRRAAGRCGLACHQMGGKATREISPETTAALGPFKSTADAWLHRVRSGPTGAFMSRSYGQLGPQLYPAWTDRILAGAVPKEPPRPRGVERNFVDQPVGLGRRQRLRARSGARRSAQSGRPARHADLRSRPEPRHPHLVRPGDPQGRLDEDPDARHRPACGAARRPRRAVPAGSDAKGAAAVALLAGRRDLERGVGAAKRPDGLTRGASGPGSGSGATRSSRRSAARDPPTSSRGTFRSTPSPTRTSAASRPASTIRRRSSGRSSTCAGGSITATS